MLDATPEVPRAPLPRCRRAPHGARDDRSRRLRRRRLEAGRQAPQDDDVLVLDVLDLQHDDGLDHPARRRLDDPVPARRPPTIPPATVGNCGNQTDALVAAINGSDMGGLNQRAGQFTIQRCRIAASSPIWAAADIVPNPGVQLDRSQVLLQRIGALWNVESVGTSNVGCPAPAGVRTELNLGCSG
jgi:hypothetical protein